MLRDSVAVVVVLRTRPLSMITMRKSTHGFSFLSYMSMGLRLAALRAAGAQLFFRYFSYGERIYFYNVQTSRIIGTLNTDDDEPRGRRPEVKFPLTALLRKLDSSSSCSSGQSRSQSPRVFWSAPRHGALE